MTIICLLANSTCLGIGHAPEARATIMPAKKATKKIAKKAPKKVTKKTAKKAVTKVAKKTAKKAAKKAAKTTSTKKTAKKATAMAAPLPHQIAEAAYYCYLERCAKGLPGDSDTDWAAAVKQLSA